MTNKLIANRSTNGNLVFYVNKAGATTQVMNIAGSTQAITMNGSLILPFRAVTGATTLTSTDYYVSASGAATYAVTLPTAVGATGLVYVVKSNMNAGVLLTVNTTSSQTIDGSTSLSLPRYNALQVISNGTNWEVL